MMTKKKTYKDIVVDGILKALEKEEITNESIHKSIRRAVKSKAKEFVERDDIKKELIEAVSQMSEIPKTIEVDYNKKKKKLKGLQHKQFEDLLKVVGMKLPIMLVGMPGAGKTTACEKVAEGMSLDFHAISVGMQTTKTDILGFIDANGKYQASGFRKAFEKGGLFLMDEVDAGNPNVLITINSGISNGFVEFPDKMVRMHEEFRFVATANTYGTGTDGRFVGRNKLDSATLDRFVVIPWEVDEALEDALTGDKDWLNNMRHLRGVVERNSVEIMITPRMSIYGSALLEAGFEKPAVREMVLFKGLDKDTRAFVEKNLFD